MPRVTIELERTETALMDKLNETAKRMFPGERVINYYHGCIAKFELDSERAAYLIEELEIKTDVVGFEPFKDWQARADDQLRLAIGTSDFPEEDDAPGLECCALEGGGFGCRPRF